jgi:hypothetical protein
MKSSQSRAKLGSTVLIGEKGAFLIRGGAQSAVDHHWRDVAADPPDRVALQSTG